MQKYHHHDVIFYHFSLFRVFSRLTHQLIDMGAPRNLAPTSLIKQRPPVWSRLLSLTSGNGRVQAQSTRDVSRVFAANLSWLVPGSLVVPYTDFVSISAFFFLCKIVTVWCSLFMSCTHKLLFFLELSFFFPVLPKGKLSDTNMPQKSNHLSSIY